jgi:tetratricopeptide (TPR) repeat protein
VHGFAVTLAWFMGEPDWALQHARKQLVIAEELAAPTLRSTSSDSMAVALMMNGQFSDALEYSELALSTARESGTLLQSEAVFLSNLCAVFAGMGEAARAVEVGREAVASARSRSTPLFELRALLHLARALIEIDAREAVTVLKQALALIERTEARGYEPFVREVLALALDRCGDTDAGRREAAGAHQLFTENGAPAHAARVTAATSSRQSGERPVGP